MRFNNLADWLHWQEGLHPTAMDLGLERVRHVARSMHWSELPFPVISVAGTNGKGSSVAYLDAIYSAAGLRTGTYTSPHLQRYNERIRINSREARDEDLLSAFARLDAARGDTTITYFEYGTLAAIDLFVAAKVDVAILEVGIGGRLDAVNVFDPDCALVTTIALDHEKWLGRTREAIGLEKAGIFRADTPAVCADPDPPTTLIQYAGELGARLHLRERDFAVQVHADNWDYVGTHQQWRGLPIPALPGGWQIQNAAGVLAVVEAMSQRLPVEPTAIAQGLEKVQLRGRFDLICQSPDVLVDVAHNPQATRALAENLSNNRCSGKTLAVLAMLADKDVVGALSPLTSHVHRWFVAPIDDPRGMNGDATGRALTLAGVPPEHIEVAASVVAAFSAAKRFATAADRIVVFGSFHTVGDVMDELDASTQGKTSDPTAPQTEKPG